MYTFSINISASCCNTTSTTFTTNRSPIFSTTIISIIASSTECTTKRFNHSITPYQYLIIECGS